MSELEIEELEDALEAKIARVAQLEKFVRSFLDPEGYGFAVNAEIRDDARALMGIPRCETGKWRSPS